LTERMRFYEDYVSFEFNKDTPVIISIKLKNLSNILEDRNDSQQKNIDLSMMASLQYLVVRVQKCVFGYTNYNEILLVLHCTDNNHWMNYNVQKIISTCSSYITQIFNRYLHTMDLMLGKMKPPTDIFFETKGFNLPQNEIINYFIYKQNYFMIKRKRHILTNNTGLCLYKIKNNELDNIAKDNNIVWNDYLEDIYGSIFTPDMTYEEYVRFGSDCKCAPLFVNSQNYFGEKIP